MKIQVAGRRAQLCALSARIELQMQRRDGEPWPMPGDTLPLLTHAGPSGDYEILDVAATAAELPGGSGLEPAWKLILERKMPIA